LVLGGGTSTVFAFAHPRRISTTTLLLLMSDNNNSNNYDAGCEDGVCIPKGVKKQQSSTLLNATTTTSSSNKIKIDIISDTMCPWCWVGKRGMEQALRECPEVEADITWLPFFLDKNLPEEGKPVEEYYVGNYGDPKAGENMKPHLVAGGKRCGIDFETNYVNMTHYRPTIRSHRLIELAKRQGKQDAMVEELFRIYYEQGQHLNSIQHLTEAATRVGLEGDIEEYLKSDQDEKEVFEEAAKLKYLAQGVPTFLFSRPGTDLEFSFSGGQTPEAFKRVFHSFSSTSVK
jgi:predicted DsbA family dithiol-disulfide isomerase